MANRNFEFKTRRSEHRPLRHRTINRHVALAASALLLAACHSGQTQRWSGNWQGNPTGYGGDLHCTVEQLDGDQWRAEFTGNCGRDFSYQITMDGTAEGEKVVFSGDADLGEQDGGVYHWTGEMDGELFEGEYTSTTGKTGTFRMERIGR